MIFKWVGSCELIFFAIDTIIESNLPYFTAFVQLTLDDEFCTDVAFFSFFFLLLCFAMSWWNSSHARRSSARYKIASSSALQHSVLESVSKFIKTIKPNKKKYSHIWHWFNSKYWHHTLHSLSFWPYRTCSLPVMTFCNLQIIWQAHNDNYGNTGCGVFKRGVQN